MTQNNKIEHDGIVKNITTDTVDVIIESLSACAGCHAKSVCGMTDAKRKTITAERPSFPIAAGDKVTVYASLNNAVYSVILAYIIPVIIIILLLFLLLYLGCDETLAAVSALGGITVYFIILYLNRRRIGRKIKFTIEKN
ncbi:SoxR reducing system RseC family protein [Odoribacter lunatus]|uniref:SoxR reducing system RseC family protein n=1 Tax=Odoribacter lunatus TaxID=2941335 RepID=UPI00203B731C|nr:SoxR reducing system RseC family protein [Odoribacter lunatus]